MPPLLSQTLSYVKRVLKSHCREGDFNSLNGPREDGPSLRQATSVFWWIAAEEIGGGARNAGG